jgi:hypothetical protein
MLQTLNILENFDLKSMGTIAFIKETLPRKLHVVHKSKAV